MIRRIDREKRHTRTALATAFIVLAAYTTAQDTEDNGANPSRIQMQRSHPQAYKGGRTIAVRLDVSASTWERLTAIGVYEKVPDGWTLNSVESIAGPAPGIAPEPGASGLLEFLWISPPRTPVSLRYELQVPPRDSGMRNFSGQVEYRLDRGKLVSNVALTQLDGEADAIPVLHLQGEPNVSLDEGEPFSDPGATATDEEDGDLTGKIQTTGEVDTSRSGRYEITYQVVDSVGNRAEPARRTVTVRAKSRPNGGGTPGGGAGGQPGSRPRPPNGLDGSAATDPDALPAREQPAEFPRAWLADLEPEFGVDRPDFDLPLAEREGGVPPDPDQAEGAVAGRTRGPDTVTAVDSNAKSLSGALATDTGAAEVPAGPGVEGGRLLIAIGTIVSASIAAMVWWGMLGKRRRRQKKAGARAPASN